MILRLSCTCDLNGCEVKGHLGSFTFCLKFFGQYMHILLCIYMALGHNDTWVEPYVTSTEVASKTK